MKNNKKVATKNASKTNEQMLNEIHDFFFYRDDYNSFYNKANKEVAVDISVSDTAYITIIDGKYNVEVYRTEDLGNTYFKNVSFIANNVEYVHDSFQLYNAACHNVW